MRARTRQELHQALSRKQHPPASIASALERVQALGYLDDARYARARAEALLGEGKMGPQAVTQHLRARGIPAEVVRSALQDAERASPSGIPRARKWCVTPCGPIFPSRRRDSARARA